MTVTEFLHQVLAAYGSTLFTLTQVTGDPEIVDFGQVWIAQDGSLTLSSDGETLEGLAELFPIVPTTNPPPHQVALSLNVNSGTMTIHTVGTVGGIRANHLQLNYFNGVLYGTATHMVFIGPPYHLEVLPG